MNELQQITKLSHEFGTEQYVLGGGGNSSHKTPETLWIKPSGTTLATITPEDFVALDRRALQGVFEAEVPADVAEREAAVKKLMLAAVRPESAGKRPSVESPLHDLFETAYVVHTHPVAVNGLTCSQEGAFACETLFPDALWVPYVDPGYALSMHVREAKREYRSDRGVEPSLVFIQNHGVFVAGDDSEAVRVAYRRVMDTLKDTYAAADIPLVLPVGEMPSAEEIRRVQRRVQDTFGEECAAFIEAVGRFEPAVGPLSPDHIVYSRSHPFVGEPAADKLQAYRDRHGYPPKVVITEQGAYGMGRSETNARLALELSKDAALVQQLAQAFGGIRFMSDEAREFIENWEVEAYRSSVA